MSDKWSEYKKQFCGCKDGSRLNSCMGLPNCELHAGHPERKTPILAAPVVEPQEPVAWKISDPNEPEIGFWFEDEPREVSSGFLSRPLYTSPPAPVAVAYPTSSDVHKWCDIHGDFGSRDVVHHIWNACLDKVKELNQ